VDVVTGRPGNLHDALIHFLEQPPTFAFPKQSPIYSVAYHPRRLPTANDIEMRLVPHTLGQPLPTMPLALRGAFTIPIDLEATYSSTCADCRL
jgi:hypothetical protein